MLLNPKESVLIKIIIADIGNNNIPVDVTGRIVEISEFKKEPLLLNDRNPIPKLLFIDPKEIERRKLAKQDKTSVR
jgi:hypothetical protein